MTTTNTARAMLASAFAALSLARGAPGQNALGGGDALDRNLGVDAGHRNVPAVTPNYRDRNLIITGDVAGGRGFRGAVGYTAEADFRGNLGSNDIFRFRADSAFSSPQLFQSGSTFEQIRFGQSMGLLLEYRRAGSGAAESIRAQDPVGSNVSPARMRLDQRAASASIALNLQQLIEPRVVGSMYGKEGQLLLFSASNVRGVTLEPAGQNLGLIGLSSFDGARIRQDVDAGQVPPQLGAPFETPFMLPGAQPQEPQAKPEAPPANAIDQKVKAEAGPERVAANLQPDYRHILERVADRYARSNAEVNVSPELLGRLGSEYQQLRDTLTGKSKAPPSPTPGATGAAENGAPAGAPPGPAGASNLPTAAAPGAPGQRRTSDQPGQTPGGVRPSSISTSTTIPPSGATGNEVADQNRPGGITPRIDTGIPRPDETGIPRRDETGRKPIPIDEMGVVLRHGQTVEHLSGQMQDRFNELVASAEQKLREGDYMLAERRFQRALRFTPGHPLATAGAAHSQLGAGLYLSASFTLRTLFSSQPEMIDVRYAADLLPNQERLAAAVTFLQAQIESSPDRASYAFLLAYIGHQTKSLELVQQGLDAMAKADPENPLLLLLKRIWLAAPEPVPQPAVVPAPAPGSNPPATQPEK